MKSNGFTALLLGVLAISALASLGLCWAYGSNVKQVRSLQQQVSEIQNNRALATALVGEVMEYSKTHADMNPILETIKVKAAPAPAVKPATK